LEQERRGHGLITITSFIGNSTGKSPGAVPCKILCTNVTARRKHQPTVIDMFAIAIDSWLPVRRHQRRNVICGLPGTASL